MRPTLLAFWSFGWSVGEALDHQHVPTVLVAHWPNRVCEYYEFVKIIARRTTALGRLLTASSFFKETR